MKKLTDSFTIEESKPEAVTMSGGGKTYGWPGRIRPKIKEDKIRRFLHVAIRSRASKGGRIANGWRRITALIGLLVMASIVIAGAESTKADTEAAGTMNDSFRVMTYNIHHGRGMDGKVSLERIAEEIRNSDADIVALQEVDRYLPRSGFRDQVGWLSRKLGMHAAYAPSMNMGPIQYGNALLSRYPIAAKRVVYLPGKLERRSLLIAELFIGGQKVTVANTHLGVLRAEWTKQMPILQAELERMDKPSILLGDFNMVTGNKYMKQMKPRFTKISLRTKMPTLSYGGEIDHILVNAPTSEAFAWVQPSDASDHQPVVALIQWHPSVAHK
ncbi:endonuclease/exonuclease/phosphatase family protein [Paenibacillus sp. MBLB4367]|uniref:endonuclease/exonuclease/phosphatase family protein n=1 Tax=Paenibacillus sp. MBLB4367 TaxID=3384767 RepID=UPI003908421E